MSILPTSKRYLLGGLLSLAVGLSIFLFGHGLIRGYLGDTVVVLFLYCCLSLIWRAAPPLKAFVVLGLAFGLELLQLVQLSTGVQIVDNLLIGTTFDPFDLVAYTFGLVLAAMLDVYSAKQDRV